MTGGAVKTTRKDASELLFRWRPVPSPWLPKLLALAFAAAAFALLMTLRIRVLAPEKSLPQRAGVMYLRDDAQGRDLSLRAQEGGPFPAKFHLSEWEGWADLERGVLAAGRSNQPPYESPIRDLPTENQLLPMELAAKGMVFLPQLPPLTAAPQVVAKMKLAPALYPLAGISRDAFPAPLPDFGATVEGASASSSWRYLIRLNPDGGVAECISLEPSGEAGSAELEAWLRQLRFKLEPQSQPRWIALGASFINQPADGTDTR